MFFFVFILDIGTDCLDFREGLVIVHVMLDFSIVQYHRIERIEETETERNEGQFGGPF